MICPISRHLFSWFFCHIRQVIILIEGMKGRGEHVPCKQKKRGMDAWQMANPMLECGTRCWKGMKGNARGLVSYSFERLKIYTLYFYLLLLLLLLFSFVRKWNYWWIANISKNLCFLGSRVCGGYIYIYIYNILQYGIERKAS